MSHLLTVLWMRGLGLHRNTVSGCVSTLHVVLSLQTSSRPVLQPPPVWVMVVMVVLVMPRPGCITTGSNAAEALFDPQLSSLPVVTRPTSFSWNAIAESVVSTPTSSPSSFSNADAEGALNTPTFSPSSSCNTDVEGAVNTPTFSPSSSCNADVKGMVTNGSALKFNFE